MGFLKPDIETRQPKSQASPLAEDVLDILRKQITGGTFGQGFGPLQREAGTAIRQFVNSRQNMDNFTKLAQPLIDINKRETERSAADLREGFGIAGSRFGTSTAVGEGMLRADALQNLDLALSQLFADESNRLLQGINEMSRQGTVNIAPFFDMARLGILPEDTIVSDSPWKIGAETLAQLVEGIGALFGARKS